MVEAADHIFAGNPLLLGKREVRQAQEVAALISSAQEARFLPVSDGRPLVVAARAGSTLTWQLAWQGLETALSIWIADQAMLRRTEDLKDLPKLEGLVYLGELQGQSYYTFNLPDTTESKYTSMPAKHVLEKLAVPKKGSSVAFIDLRTLMMATAFDDPERKADLAIVGYARALLGWHAINRFCGKCGSKTDSVQFGLRRVCSLNTCTLKLYPRIDPVVIMCVIDKQNDVILLGRGARHPTHMYSCLAGFIEPGESLEEAVRRETREETGVEIGEVVHHSSQPWPVGYGTQQCQLMVGFFAYANSFEVKVDQAELADARWFTRTEVRAAFSAEVYATAQRDAQDKIAKACFDRLEEAEAKLADIRGRTEPSAMFVPDAYAIAHHLIMSWVNGESGVLHSRV